MTNTEIRDKTTASNHVVLAIAPDIIDEAEKSLTDLSVYTNLVILYFDQLVIGLASTAAYNQLIDDELLEHYMDAYQQLLGEWEQMDPSDDFNKWAELYPIILRAWNHARYCLHEHPNIERYPKVFQDYCARGGVGKIPYQQAQQRVSGDKGAEEKLGHMHAYRKAVLAIYEALKPLDIEQKPRIMAIYKKFLDQFAYELAFAAPNY